MAHLSVCIQFELHEFSLNVGFHIKGNTTAILGASGAGKTLTLQAIAGLLNPTTGCISLDEKKLFDSNISLSIKARDRGIGLVFQDYALFPHLNVRENLVYGLTRQSRQLKSRRIQELIDLLNLNDLLGRFPHEISGGEQQRVALGRALAPEPKLLLLDEPFSALDIMLRSSLTNHLKMLQSKLEFPMVIVTHDIEEAYKLASELVLLEKGSIIQQGDRETVFNSPNSPASAKLVGYRNLLPGRVVTNKGREAIIELEGCYVRLLDTMMIAGEEVIVGIRSEVITVSNGKKANDGSGLSAEASIIDSIRMGTKVELHLQVESVQKKNTQLHATIVDSKQDLDLQPGSKCTLAVNAEYINVWRANPVVA